MGAVVGVEILRPVDASDIRETGSLAAARGEIIRLREKLGHLAKQAGFGDVVYDASDLVLGEKESEDFERCIAEIVHIRSALRLSTQSSRRQTRAALSGKFSESGPAISAEDEKYHSESGESSSEDSDN